MIDTNMLNETMEHFEPKEKEQEKDRFAGFKSYNVGGRQVIDLTSIDEDYEPVSFNYMDIERRGIYGNDAGNPNKL